MVCEKPVPVPFHPPQTPRRLAWAGVQISQATNRPSGSMGTLLHLRLFLVFRFQFQSKVVCADIEYLEPILKARFCSILCDEVRLKISPEIWKGQINYFPTFSVFRWQNISWYTFKPFLPLLSSHLVARPLTSSSSSDPNWNYVCILETSKSTNVTNNRNQNTKSVYHFQRSASTERQHTAQLRNLISF